MHVTFRAALGGTRRRPIANNFCMTCGAAGGAYAAIRATMPVALAHGAAPAPHRPVAVRQTPYPWRQTPFSRRFRRGSRQCTRAKRCAEAAVSSACATKRAVGAGRLCLHGIGAVMTQRWPQRACLSAWGPISRSVPPGSRCRHRRCPGASRDGIPVRPRCSSHARPAWHWPAAAP